MAAECPVPELRGEQDEGLPHPPYQFGRQQETHDHKGHRRGVFSAGGGGGEMNLGEHILGEQVLKHAGF